MWLIFQLNKYNRLLKLRQIVICERIYIRRFIILFSSCCWCATYQLLCLIVQVLLNSLLLVRVHIKFLIKLDLLVYHRIGVLLLEMLWVCSQLLLLLKNCLLLLLFHLNSVWIIRIVYCKIISLSRGRFIRRCLLWFLSIKILLLLLIVIIVWCGTILNLKMRSRVITIRVIVLLKRTSNRVHICCWRLKIRIILFFLNSRSSRMLVVVVLAEIIIVVVWRSMLWEHWHLFVVWRSARILLSCL